MALFLFGISLIGIPVGLVLLIIGRIKKKKLKGGIVLGVSVVLFFGSIMMYDSKDNEKKVEVASKTQEELDKEKNKEVEQIKEEEKNKIKEAEEKVATEQKVKNEKAINVPKYKIEEDNFGKGMWRVTLSTPSTDEKELKALVEETKKLAKDKYKDVSSIWVNVKTENSVANTYSAMAKVALDDKGKAATGLNEIDVFEFKYNVDETHKTTKADLKQSTASYSAEDILKAFQDAGLPTTDSRDNSHNCISLECTTLITTEDVSIYEWPSVEKAQEVRAKKFGDAQVGTIIIRMNNKSLDIQPYIDVLNSIIN